MMYDEIGPAKGRQNPTPNHRQLLVSLEPYASALRQGSSARRDCADTTCDNTIQAASQHNVVLVNDCKLIRSIVFLMKHTNVRSSVYSTPLDVLGYKEVLCVAHDRGDISAA